MICGRRRARQRGFTLIELMVALLISSLLVGMILAIFSRMSIAYRSQQQIAGVQQVLAAARATIEIDAKQAGLGMPQGFTTAITGTTLQSPVKVTDGGVGVPDQVAFFYADTSTQAVMQTGTLPVLTVDSVTGFTAGMLVVLATASTMASPNHPTDPYVATYQACVLKVLTASGTTITFDNTAPWGPVGNAGCALTNGSTMIYPLVAHAYKIDTSTPARAALGPLVESTTGGLLGASETWLDLAYGFSDIQTALRLQDNTGTDLDADSDAQRNWYSGANQVAATTLPITPANAMLLGMSISLVAHTDRSVEGIATATTPALQQGTIASFNQLGNNPSSTLPTAPPWPNPLLPGAAIYRYTTFQVDFRNLGVGQ